MSQLQDLKHLETLIHLVENILKYNIPQLAVVAEDCRLDFKGLLLHTCSPGLVVKTSQH
jgi:hypothetical protein